MAILFLNQRPPCQLHDTIIARMESIQVKDRIIAAQKLLSTPSLDKETFGAVQSLLKGINPKVDIVLDTCSKSFNQLQKIQNMEIIELTAESIPETTEKDKKRKKYLLLFIKYWKQLKSEVGRVQGEL